MSGFSNVWYPTILNTSKEFTEVANMVRTHVSGCGLARIGGSTNIQPVTAFNFSDYIPNTLSGKLLLEI